MSWWQLSLDTPEVQAPEVEALFEALGALSVTFGDAGDAPLLEPPLGEMPLWERTRVTALFEGTRDPKQLTAALAQALDPLLANRVSLEHLEDQDWERCWLDAFRPTKFGRRLWVCPHGQPPDDPGGVVIELDPGLAFGTGSHPTTALCLRWLDQAPLNGRRVIDYGCGSGILGIAALKLGAAAVIAVDQDPQALQATQSNAEKNRVAHRLQPCLPAQLQTPPAQLLVANILAGTLIELAPTFDRLVAAGGQLVLSGILTYQAPRVAAAYRDSFALDPPWAEEDWALISGSKPAG